MRTFQQYLEARQKGPSLAETDPQRYGYRGAKAVIYRAVPDTTGNFSNMDYVTMSLKFAREHAQHNAAVTEEPSAVLRARVSADQVFDAYNPGEYFYDGETIPGKVIYVAKP